MKPKIWLDTNKICFKNRIPNKVFLRFNCMTKTDGETLANRIKDFKGYNLYLIEDFKDKQLK